MAEASKIEDLPDLSTPQEVASVLRCSPRFVQDECKAGRLNAALSAGAQQAQGGDIADPLDTPLPCDVNVPNMRFGKGIPLRVLVDAAARWKVIAAKVPLAEMEPALEQARASGLLPKREDGDG
ncbi:hypothetical protein FBZ84_101121 [Azospirillum baldaniorum]|uniref:hypothetical protein n=1 Tax=Azospirillum baldaniorum TaxID=1064539 RepID=UPI00119D2E3A|nr:hypothetical protein [Azospirillum baldaniorum]TWA71855.1 hypothetical protein FBZ84_101121 [Azospirillum baldaniorum]